MATKAMGGGGSEVGNGFTVFGNDPDYLKWRRANPDKYVLNTNRGFSSSHTKLHRAKCSVLERAANTTRPGYLTGVRYFKVGADTSKIAMRWLHARRSECEATWCRVCCSDRIATQGDSVGNG